MERFRDRVDAGRRLADLLGDYKDRSDVVVLALPRGGLPVGSEVAKALGAPLDVYMVRKLGVPGQEELAMGAIATGGVRVLNEEVIDLLGITEDTVAATAVQEQEELTRREREYRGGRKSLDLEGRTVILVDDGLATGSTMRAAVMAVREQGAGQVVVAVPVAAPQVSELFQTEADEVVCAATPELFMAVGTWYEDFPQITDEEVRDQLEHAATERGSGPPPR
jgi:putative phosphoribosyl transferase